MGGAADVRIVKDRQDPQAVERLLRSLPDWFGLEQPLLDYVADARTKPTYLALDDASGRVVGALVVTRHWSESAEMHLLAVDPQHHRRGVGSRLVMEFEEDMRRDGVRLLEVKTLGPSYPDEHYDQTRLFYLAMGYLPLDEIHGYWPGNPCLIMVKPLSPTDLHPTSK